MARRGTPPPAPGNPALALQLKAVQRFGKTDQPTADEYLKSVYGIPLIGMLPMQYLFGISVVPLGRCIEIIGPYGSCKSVLGWVFAKLFLEHRALVVFLDGEHKTNPDQIRGIVQNDELLHGNMIPSKLHTLDEGLAHMLGFMQIYEEEVPHRDRAIMLLFDSIASLTSLRMVASLETKGDRSNAGFDAAQRAAELTEQLRSFIPNQLSRNPALLVMINHEKESVTSERPSYMPKETNVVGGVHQEFASTFTLAMRKIGGTEVLRSESRVPLKIITRKSGFSPTGMEIVVHMVTRYVADRILVYLDWDRALVDLLLSNKVASAAVKDVLDIVKDGHSYSSKTLGLEKVSSSELGMAIHANPSLVSPLQEVLHVLRKQTFTEKLVADGIVTSEPGGTV